MWGSCSAWPYEVVPVCLADVGPRAVMVTYGLVFEHMLDAEKLRNALSELIHTKWRKAGARLRVLDGRYEFHVPLQYNEDVPPFAFEHTHASEPYACGDRPAIPLPTSRPSLIPMPDFEGFLCSALPPHNLMDFLGSDEPLLRVCVTTFEDATFLGLTSSHLFLDAMGARALFGAWIAVLNQQIESILPMDTQFVPFRGWERLAEGIDVAGPWSLPTPEEKEAFDKGAKEADTDHQMRLLCIPKKILDRWKVDANLILQDTVGEKVGSTDILHAWITKMLHAHCQPSDKRSIYIHIPVDLRPLLPSELNQPILNAFDEIGVPPFPASSVSSLSLASLALSIRRAVNVYKSSPEDIKLATGFKIANAGRLSLRGNPCSVNGHYVLLSNWRVAGFGQLDFSGALPDGQVGKARVKFMAPCIMTNGQIVKGLCWIAAEDEEVVWTTIVLGKRDWPHVEQSSNAMGFDVLSSAS